MELVKMPPFQNSGFLFILGVWPGPGRTITDFNEIGGKEK